MKLGSFRRIYKQDFKPDQQDLADQLGTTINNGFEQLYDGLDGKLSFRDNILATISEFTITVDSEGTPRQTTVLKLNSKQTIVEGVYVIGAIGANNPNLLPLAAPFVSYTKNAQTLIIDNVRGLLADNAYKIKLVAIS